MIVVTGIGIVSAYGVGKDAFLQGVKKGAGIDVITHFDTDALTVNTGGAVKNFVPKQYIQPMKFRRMSRFSQLALVSAIEAWSDSSIQGCYKPSEIGIIVGTGLGSVYSSDSFYVGLLEKGPQETNPMIFPETVQNIAAAHISMEFGIVGPNATFGHAAIAGENALFYACELLENGTANALLVTGSDELTKPVLEGMNSLRILSRKGIMKPFDVERDGLVPGEGACTLILERKDDAQRRAARIYGEVVCFGFSSEPVERLNFSSTASMVEAMRKTVRDETPDIILASANSTKELDRKEAAAIREVFAREVPVTATSSMTGFFMSSGVMKAGAAMLFMSKEFLPPIWGLENPEIELQYVIEPQEQKINTVLVNAFSHGGTNACIVLRGMN